MDETDILFQEGLAHEIARLFGTERQSAFQACRPFAFVEAR
jgi:hypothetical protein